MTHTSGDGFGAEAEVSHPTALGFSRFRAGRSRRYPRMSPKMTSVLILVCALPAANGLAAGSADGLWLPLSYQQLMPELRAAAAKAEATGHCEVLQGSLHGATEDPGQAVFALTCRDARRRTYPVFVDANSLELDYPLGLPSTSPSPSAVPDSSTDAVGARVKEMCEQLFSEQTRSLLGLRRLPGEPQNEPSLPREADDGSVSLLIDFDARTPQGQPLYYRAECRVSGSAGAKLIIRARRQG